MCINRMVVFVLIFSLCCIASCCTVFFQAQQVSASETTITIENLMYQNIQNIYSKPLANIWFIKGVFKFVEENEEYVFVKTIQATLLGLGPGVYRYELSGNLQIKIMKPFYGIMPHGPFPSIGVGLCRQWEYDVE